MKPPSPRAIVTLRSVRVYYVSPLEPAIPLRQNPAVASKSPHALELACAGILVAICTAAEIALCRLCRRRNLCAPRCLAPRRVVDARRPLALAAPPLGASLLRVSSRGRVVTRVRLLQAKRVRHA